MPLIKSLWYAKNEGMHHLSLFRIDVQKNMCDSLPTLFDKYTK